MCRLTGLPVIIILLLNSMSLKRLFKSGIGRFFGNIFHKKKIIFARFQGIQKALDVKHTQCLVDLEDKLLQDYYSILNQEACFWKQKSRVSWLKDDDRNTKIFHMSTLIRRRKNRLERLKDGSGVWMERQEDLKAVVVDFFKDLFTDRSSNKPFMNLPNFFPLLLEDEVRDLNAQVENSAIKDCLFAIGPLKAPGIDGFPAFFFQHCWNEYANDVTASVQHCFQHNRIPPGMNETLITLLPKVPNPISMNQIRPISLCTTMYKVVSKLLVCKLWPIMEKIISLNQVSFVPGHHITDNIVIAQEILHKFKLAKGKNGFLAWKIDLSKAYDRLSWGFIAYVLSEIGIDRSLLQLILSCISSVSFRAIVNGELSDAFQPGCGIRQGDPFSPYLFVIYMEKLNHLITHEVNKKRWKPVKMIFLFLLKLLLYKQRLSSPALISSVPFR
ncbi:hypothetical protein ACFX1T_002484 [Malus domestica]